MQSNQPNANTTQAGIQYQSSQSFVAQNPPKSGFTLVDRVKKSFDLTTPQILRRSMFALWGLGLIWVPVSIQAIQTQRNSLKVIAKDSIPSVLLATRLVTAMTDMDASAANALLDPDQKNKILIQEPQSLGLLDGKKLPEPLTPEQYFNKRRIDLAERLTLAAKNITAEEEKAVIESITLGFGDYLTYVERSQAANRVGDKEKALAEYNKAAKLLDSTLVPQGYRLRDINHNILERQYRISQNANQTNIAYMVVLGLATIVGLGMLQYVLTVRTKRVLNPLLLGATVTAILFLLGSVQLLLSSRENLRVIKEDSYNSLSALRTGRALMYAANSSESRYLLDKKNRAAHEAAFFTMTNQAFNQSDSLVFLDKVVQVMEQEKPKLAQKQKFSVEMKGEFAVAINNITFPKEQEDLTEMMTLFQSYMQLDQRIRSLIQQNNENAARELCLGTSNDVFVKFKDTMGRVSEINQKVLDKADQNANEQLANFELKAAIALALMAGLIFFGLQPRLKEYS